MSQTVFERRESNVRSYCRSFPIVFDKAQNATLISEEGVEYIDFLAGAGTINYGHNNAYIKSKVLEYLSDDRLLHALDMFTVAKKHFLETLEDKVLRPKNMDYKVMFCGSTGTNAVEAALKLARKNTKRTGVFAFCGAFHGMTLGSLAMTTDRLSREGAGVPLHYVTMIPYYDAFPDPQTSLDYLENLLSDDHSGVELPAAIVLETVQAEGGINVAPVEWLQRLRAICDKYGILMICDDIQVGVCRTGNFFSFERAGVLPDLITLSKSIGGLGFPMSLLLMRPELDIFKPAEHNGTFRGNQIAFVSAAAALEWYAENDMPAIVAQKEQIIRSFLEKEILPLHEKLSVRGIGMIWGIDFSAVPANEGVSLSKLVQQCCVDNGLIIERAGRGDSVLKILPPLTIPAEQLLKGLQIIKNAVSKILL